MTTKRHVVIITSAVCAAALAAPLAFADGSTADEPESSGTIVYVDPAPSIAPADVEQVEAPLQVTDTTEEAVEDVAEEPELEPSATTSEEPVFPHPMCGGYLVKGDYLPPPVAGEEIVVDEPDPEPEVAVPADDGSADDLAVDDGPPGDSGDAGVLDGQGSIGFDESVIVEEPTEAIDDGAELTGP